MGDVVPITANALPRVETAIRDELTANGGLVEHVGTLPVDVKAWRAAARRVAKSMSRPVRTGVHPQGHVVWASLSDWPATPDEEVRQREAMRRAVASASDPE